MAAPYKILTPERVAALVQALNPQFLGRQQTNLLFFADEIADEAFDLAALQIVPLQQFQADIQSPGGASMIGITDSGNYFGGTGNVNAVLQNIGSTLATVGTGNAPLNNPVFTGDPQAPTAAVGDNDQSIATTAFVKSQGYATIASPTFTGDPKAPTPATADNDTSVATTAFVKAQGYQTAANVAALYAPLASPALTGVPTVPTAATATNTTQAASTAYVKAQGYQTAANVATALGPYALDAGLAHLAGTETLTGAKTFSLNTGFTNGINTGNQVVAAINDLTKHLQLNSTGGGYGMSVTAGATNVIAGTGGAINFAANSATTPDVSINSGGVFFYGADEVGYRSIPRVTGALSNGKMFAAVAGFTVNTGPAAGTLYNVYNNSGGAITITQGAGGTQRKAGTATTGNLSLAQRGYASIWFNTTTEWIISGDVS